MALTAVHVNPPADAYLGGLRAVIASISPALLDRDRWGFQTLKEVYGIDETSHLYSRSDSRAKGISIRPSADQILSDVFLRGIGYDFTIVPEPFRTELKAFFAWRLARPQHRSREPHCRTVRLIAFCHQLSANPTALPRLIDYGHPIEFGAGNGSSPLRNSMELWLNEVGLSTTIDTPEIITRDESGSRVITRHNYRCQNSMPANELTFILVLLRERMKLLERRDLILMRDLYPEEEIAEAPRRESYIHFYGFRLDWLRHAARHFILSKINHQELRPTSLPGFISRLQLLETCLREEHADPQIEHVTESFIRERFLNWGNTRKCVGKNWYADVCNLVRYASCYLADRGWPNLMLDKRDLRRVEGMWPGGRGYQLKVTERTIPDDIIEQMFQKLDSLDPVLKRLLILGRYTGMRSADLHALDFDCLKDDPDDPRFMILTFYQSKVQRWNTKPLLREDAAHSLVIMTIREQQTEVRQQWEHETKYLFPTRTGDGETTLTGDYTRDAIKKWMLTEGIRTKDGVFWEFGWHGLRHFHGTELALQGHDIALIQMELGHGSADMTMVYINRRLHLKKKALLEKGGGRFIDIKGQVDNKMAALAVRRDATLAVDVPGGLCSLPSQLGEWCEHNRACMTCIHFRADVDQLAFFDQEYAAITDTIARLKQEVAEYREQGRTRMAEIGEKRLAHNQALFINLTTIIATIKAEGSYRGDTHKYQRPTGSNGGEAHPQAPGR